MWKVTLRSEKKHRVDLESGPDETEGDRMKNSDLLYFWPKNAAGEPEEAALLPVDYHAVGYAELCCSMLESFQIPYFTRRPDVGGLSYTRGLVVPMGEHIYVPASRLEEAKAVLRAPVEPAEEEYEEETQ